MQSLANDFAFLRAAVGDLQDYLLSSQLYWRLLAASADRSAGKLLQLTPGNLLLCQRRLTAVAWDAERQVELDRLVQQSTLVLAQWKVHLAARARQEAHARLEQWSAYLKDLPGGAAGYPFQVRSRAILSLLDPVAGPNAEVGESLPRLDAVLKNWAETGPFVWEAETAPGFPVSEYWFLYLKIHTRMTGK